MRIPVLIYSLYHGSITERRLRMTYRDSGTASNPRSTRFRISWMIAQQGVDNLTGVAPTALQMQDMKKHALCYCASKLIVLRLSYFYAECLAALRMNEYSISVTGISFNIKHLFPNLRRRVSRNHKCHFERLSYIYLTTPDIQGSFKPRVATEVLMQGPLFPALSPFFLIGTIQRSVVRARYRGANHVGNRASLFQGCQFCGSSPKMIIGSRYAARVLGPDPVPDVWVCCHNSLQLAAVAR
ncbi:hypothetical protein K449DRAFT_461891 [Hypoxylon sp. EC38]|nr:hypothetical protein K449DRAFT_461891 [Hypoxylon sp. EC38]